jgi:hypothetical protein
MTNATITLTERAGHYCIVFRDPTLILAGRIPARGLTLESLKVSVTSRGILLQHAKKIAKQRKCAFIDETA